MLRTIIKDTAFTESRYHRYVKKLLSFVKLPKYLYSVLFANCVIMFIKKICFLNVYYGLNGYFVQLQGGSPYSFQKSYLFRI